MYDKITHFTMNFPSFDFGGDADEVFSFRLPTGFRARLVKIGVSVTELFACDTTPASVKLGTAADADAYAALNIADGTADVDCFDETDDTDAIIAANIAPNVLLQVTLGQSVDGSADAGQGIPYLVFELFKI